MLVKLVIATLVVISFMSIGFAQMEAETVAETPIETEMSEGEVMEILWITTDEGLRYRIIQEGNGEVAKNGDQVFVHYTGTLTDGTKFDSSHDRNQPFDFPLGSGRVIKGWDIGVAGMKIGEIRELYIPSDLAYGARGAGALIQPNTDLLFTVELLELK